MIADHKVLFRAWELVEDLCQPDGVGPCAKSPMIHSASLGPTIAQRFCIKTASMWLAERKGRSQNLMTFSCPKCGSAVYQFVMLYLRRAIVAQTATDGGEDDDHRGEQHEAARREWGR